MKRSGWLFGALLAASGCLGRPAAAQEPLTLPDVLGTALRNNSTLRAARHARDAALAGAQPTRPGLRPDVHATASHHFRGPVVRFPKVTPNGVNNVVVLPSTVSLLDLTLEQPLYQFGIGKAPAQRYSSTMDAARADYRKAELDLQREVEEAYLSALRAQALERVAAEAVSYAEEQLRVAQLLEAAGEVARLDVYKAEESLEEARSGLLQAQNGVRLAKANLNRLMERPQGTDFTLAPVEGEPPEPPPTEDLLPSAFRRRPEAQALRARLETAQAGVQLARSQRLPRITADADYRLQNPSAFVPSSSWAAGVSATVPIFETLGIRSDVRQAQEAVGQAEAGLAALRQGIALEIEQHRLAQIEARERLRVAERAITSAGEARRVTLLLYQEGFATVADVQGTSVALTRAEANRQQAIYDMWLAHARLRRALGLPPGPGLSEEDEVEPGPGKAEEKKGDENKGTGEGKK
jgi:outer membrane protein